MTSQYFGAVPLPIPLGVGQRDSTLNLGTASGIARDSFSLKSFIQAKKCCPKMRENIGQQRDSTQKILSQRSEAVGQQNLAYFSQKTFLTPEGVSDVDGRG